MMKAGPALAIIGGVVFIVFDSIAINNLDKTFEPYYEFMEDCKNILSKYTEIYIENNDKIEKMYSFMIANKESFPI